MSDRGRAGVRGCMSERMGGWMSEPVGRLLLRVVTEKVSQPHRVFCAREFRELDVFSFSTVEALGVLTLALVVACHPLPTERCTM